MVRALPEQLCGLRPRLLRAALRCLRDRDQAEDAVQEALLAALEGLEGFAGEAALATWVHGILRHKIADRMRAVRPEQLGEPDELAARDAGPEAPLARRRVFEALECSLARLPPATARAFVLSEVLGVGTPEICRELAVSAPHCWVMLHRARRRLRQCPTMRALAADAL